MKIVQVCRLYAPHLGGVETHVQEVNRQLVADGHEVTVLTTQDKWDEKLQEVIDGVMVIRQPLASVNNKAGTWKWIWSQQRCLFEADRIQVHDVAWWLTLLWPMIEDKTFITFHGWETTYPIRWQAKLQRWVFSVLSKGRVHVGGWIKEFYWDRPTYITYGGVRPAKKTTLINKSSKNKIKIVFLGRIAADNDIDLYLQLAELLQQQKIKPEIIWVGDGPERKKSETVGTVLGYQANVEEYLVKADVVWASSYLSILQAQSLGKLVCAFYSNPLKKRYLETYPAADLLLLSNSPAVMADTLRQVWDNANQRQQLEHQAKVFAQQQSWQSVTNMYYRLWSI